MIERDICDDYAALAQAVDSLVDYVDSCDPENGGDGSLDTGDVLECVLLLRQIRQEHQGVDTRELLRCPTRPTPYDDNPEEMMVGCGCTALFVSEGDGSVDCACCGIWFQPIEEYGVDWANRYRIGTDAETVACGREVPDPHHPAVVTEA